MDLFPLGTVSANVGTGVMDGISYSMFEPNNGSSSNKKYHNLLVTYESMAMSTRKKAEPSLNLSYKYDGIFTREYRQLVHFIDFVEDSLNSFYLVDFSKGMNPSSVTTPAYWEVSIGSTRLFSTIPNQKSHYAFFWNAYTWKIGEVVSISANTSISCDISNNYGDMTATQAQITTGKTRTFIYPMYEVYINSGADSFKEQEYVDLPVSLTTDGGYTYTGDLVFTSRYKV